MESFPLRREELLDAVRERADQCGPEFKAVGRSPMLGMIVGFLSINAAGDANPFIAPSDVVFAKIATEAAHIVDPDAIVRATDNTYFTTVSAVVLAIVLTVVTEKVLSKREHELVPDDDATGPTAGTGSGSVPEEVELRALRRTGVVAAVFVGLLVVGMIPAGSRCAERTGPSSTPRCSPESRWC
nr:AbgT family transporter [Streptomyces sp. NP-1717]